MRRRDCSIAPWKGGINLPLKRADGCTGEVARG